MKVHRCNRILEISWAVAILAVVFALPSGLLAQSSSSLHGVVKDPSGAVVTSAEVKLQNPETKIQRQTTTDANGDFQFLQVPPGKYQITVSALGFKTHVSNEVQLLINTPTTANVTLEIGNKTEAVEVSGEAATINTVDASMGNPFNNAQIQALPLEGRNVVDLLSLQTGAVYTGNRPDQDVNNDTRSGAVNGARSDQSNVTLDGVDVNDQNSGYAFTSVLPVTLDSVQEFRVTTTNYNADQGVASGAQVSLVTKSGTNHWHGSLYEYNRNTATSANDWFIKGAQAASGVPNQAPQLIRNIFGGSVGGPIIKDRLFFFTNLEFTRMRQQDSVVRVVPSALLRQGTIQYIDVNGNVQQLNAAQVTGLDPLGLGPNAASLAFFNSYPLPNDTSVGDGYNFSGYRWAAPVKINNNAYIARIDWNMTKKGNMTLFWRGAMQNYSNQGTPFLPGQVPEQTTVNFSKGMVTGWTWVINNSNVNNFKWGYTRQSVGVVGNSNQPWIIFRELNDGNGSPNYFRSHNFQMPVNNIIDDFSSTHGRHSLGFGINFAWVRNPRQSQEGSFSDGVTNADWVDTGGLSSSQNSPLNPANAGYPAVASSFTNSFDFPLAALLGMVTEVDASYNYTKTGAVLPQGAPVQRRFAADWYDFYAQDQFHWKPNLTLTFGLRYSLTSPPWETNGLQVSPTPNLGNLANARGQGMFNGVPSNQDPLIQFNLGGPVNNGPGFYNWGKNNWAPRAAFAWTPSASGGWLKKLLGESGQTVIRGGFGMVYDHIGIELMNTFDSNGAFGLSTGLTNPAGVLPVENAPRITSVNVIPTTTFDGTQQLFLPAPPGTFPQTPPYTQSTGGFAIAWGMDPNIKNPYAYTINFGFARDLGHNFSLEAAYVGRLSHRLLTQSELMMPLNLYDTKSGINYFTAAQALVKLYNQGVPTSSVTNASLGPTAAYWQNMVQALQQGGAYSLYCSGGSTTDVSQAVYDLYSCFKGNDTTSLSVLDTSGIPDANLSGVNYGPNSGLYSYFNRQYSSLYAWRSIGNANYNALEVTFKKNFSQGLQFTFNYTYSKSIDLSSDAARIGPHAGLGGQVINAWSPNALRAISDYDLPQQINFTWVYSLPFGHGEKFGTNSKGWVNAIAGGWQLTGLGRWTSGFPMSVDNGYAFPTNWELEGNAVQTAPVQTGFSRQPDGSPNMFVNPQAALAAFRGGMPGESGSRNTFRGDGFAGLDMGLNKTWKMWYAESQAIQFRWEVFNVPNLHRFDVQSHRPEIDQSASFGNYTNLLTNPRVMQFALRYTF
jgi:hypothetical protein